MPRDDAQMTVDGFVGGDEISDRVQVDWKMIPPGKRLVVRFEAVSNPTTKYKEPLEWVEHRTKSSVGRKLAGTMLVEAQLVDQNDVDTRGMSVVRKNGVVDESPEFVDMSNGDVISFFVNQALLTQMSYKYNLVDISNGGEPFLTEDSHGLWGLAYDGLSEAYRWGHQIKLIPLDG